MNKTKKAKKFSFYFSIATSILIAIAVIATTFYLMMWMNALRIEYLNSSDKYDSFVMDSLKVSVGRDIADGDFTETNKLTFLLSNEPYGYVNYAYMYDTSSGKILWASEKSFYQFTDTLLKESVLPARNNINNLSLKEANIVANYRLVVGMTKSTAQDNSFASMLKQLQVFVLIFILVAVIVSAIVSTMINRPLMSVVTSVQEFGKGNLKQKLSYTGFEEIDKLVTAYNEMSGQLSDLYESLEKKVEERTKELEQANLKLKETQSMMVHSEKMRSLGELVAGIAHEINNPINFIYGNIMILDNYQKDLIKLVDLYSEADFQIDKELIKKIVEHKQNIDFDFLKEDIGDLIQSCKEGVERTKNIILDLKNFSRMEEMVFSECNIPKEIDTTLNILNNKIKNRITVHKDYEENVPKIEAYGGQINQVFMNILDNAQGAIKGTGDIYVTVKREGDYVKVQFEDTGCGIKPENLHKIFEPFYTTKPVGQGTGLGMSIAYKVIQSHNGKLDVESEVGKGTKFTILLPIEHKQTADSENQESNDAGAKVNE